MCYDVIGEPHAPKFCHAGHAWKSPCHARYLVDNCHVFRSGSPMKQTILAHTTHIYAIQHNKQNSIQEQHTPSTWSEKINDEVTRITIDVMSAAHTDKIKNIAKNTATIICGILNHSEESFVMEIKPISWSCPDPIFFKNEYPNPILIRKNHKYPAGYPILILSMLTSVVRILKFDNPIRSEKFQ